MATAARVRPLAPPAAHDRKFYCGIALAMALTVFLGFAPTFFLRAIFHKPTPTGVTSLPLLMVVHGLLFSSWVALFIVQTTLVAKRNVAAHRKLGIAGGVLAVAMIVAGTALALATARRGAGPPGADPLAFLVVPLGDMVMFTLFIASALALRRDKETHKRLMILAYISIIGAAVARLPGVLPLGPFWFYGLSFIFLGAAAIYDIVTRRRLHPVYLWGGLALVLSVPGRLTLSATPLWHSFATFLVGR